MSAEKKLVKEDNWSMIRKLFMTILLFPLFLTADTIIVKTKAPQNRNAVFQYRVPRGYDKNRREMYRVLVIFGGRNTDGKAEIISNTDDGAEFRIILPL